MTVPVTKNDENGYLCEYEEIKYLDAHFQVKTGVTPFCEHGDHFLGDLSLGEKHPEYLVPEDGFQLFQFQRRRDPEHAVPVKAAVRHQNVTVGIKSEEVAKALNSNDCAGDGVVLMDRLLEKDLQGFPGTTA